MRSVANNSFGLDINSRIIFALGVFSFLSESVSDGLSEKNADSDPDIIAAINRSKRTNKMYITVDKLKPNSAI
jgi:hypothetical protein